MQKGTNDGARQKGSSAEKNTNTGEQSHKNDGSARNRKAGSAKKRPASNKVNAESKQDSANKQSTASQRNENKTQGSLSKQGGRKPLPRRRNKKSEQLRIIPLGGLDGIGKNMTVFEYKNDLIVVDAGLMFPDDDHPGVDLILPDYTYLLENVDRLRGIVITHGHEDHTGSLPYLLKDIDRKIPIYSSNLTLGLIEGKFAEFRIKNADLREVKTGNQLKVGEFLLEFFSVNHSIPAAMGVFISTPAGNVLHTGDFKLDQTPIDGVKTDFAAISRFARSGVDLLLSDSTNAANPNFTRSESEVGKVLKQIIQNAEKRVIVAAFSSHIHRIQQVCDAARMAKRKVAVTGRSMLTNTQIARDLGYLKVPEGLIVDAYAAKDIPPDQVVIMCTGSQGEPLSALARMANSEHRTMEIEEGDTVIIAATPVPGNEKAVTRVINALSKIGADVYDKHRALVHVSGHGGAEELKLMLTMSKPRNFMPVHGEALHLRAHAKLAEDVGLRSENIFLLENGESLILDAEGVRHGESVESGIIYVDGLSVGDVSNVVLKDRQTLASDGIVTVVVMLRKRDSKAAGEPEIIMRGVSGGDDPDLIADSIKTISKTVDNFSQEHRNNPNRLQRAMRESLSKLLWERVRRRPMIIPIIMEV